MINTLHQIKNRKLVYNFPYMSSKWEKSLTKVPIAQNVIKTDPKWMLLLNNCSKTVSGHFFAICIFIFHKTEAHTVILRCTMGLNLNWFKSYGLRCSKMQSFPFLIFNDFVKKTQMCVFCIFGFCVITFVPIKI